MRGPSQPRAAEHPLNAPGVALPLATPAPFHATPRGWAGPNLLAGVLFVAALVAGAIPAALVAGLLGVVGSLLHPMVGSLLGVLVMFGYAAVVLVLLVGTTYLAWRDTFGDAAPSSSGHVHGFEA